MQHNDYRIRIVRFSALLHGLVQLVQLCEDNRSGCGAGVLIHHTNAVIPSTADSGQLGINFKVYASVTADTLQCAAERSSSRRLVVQAA